MKPEYDFSKGVRGAVLDKSGRPTDVLKRLRAIRDDLNEELAGKSFAEQQKHVRKALKTTSKRRSRTPATRSPRRPR